MYMPREHRFHLGSLTFVWDSGKNRANAAKHGVAFEEAATTWLDSMAIERFDDEHSQDEDRRFHIGLSLRGALLVSWWTIRLEHGDEIIRIIGSRRANRSEWRLYEEKNR